MMHDLHNAKVSGGRKGQTLVIAITVMFLLALVAAVFIAMVARNMFRSERFSNMDAVAQIAEAGVRYADQMLTTSEDGADWRPKPDNRGVQKNNDGTIKLDNTGKPLADPAWTDARDNDPDFKWTRAYWKDELEYCGPTGGYTKFDWGDGRFLLRVAYNPDPAQPHSKYIRIESIGRWGLFDNNDPTTYKRFTDSQLRREITAYKPIGITDYARFITNVSGRTSEFALGWPGHTMNFGRTTSKYGMRGAPIRVNGNLLWCGKDNITLRAAHPLNPDGTADTTTLVPIDSVDVSGEIRHQVEGSSSEGPLDTNVTLKITDLTGNTLDQFSTFSNDPTHRILPSNSDFITAYGFYRDGSPNTDASPQSRPRSVKRIEPPMVDQADPTKTSTRYRVLTLNSGQRISYTQPNGRTGWLNLGSYGWGRGVYIGNINDKQDESETLVGGYTLISDWLKPNNPMSTYWKGPYYVPPAAVIVLHPDDTDGDGQPDFSITRTDTLSNGQKWVWYDAWGNVRREWGETVTMPYPNANGGRTIYYRNPDGTWQMNKSRVIDGNGVIYAEGNIRIRGMLPKGVQLTVASNETIYIDGNVLKYRDPKATVSDTDPWRGADNTCGLALLAKENICVNTTQFLSPQNSISSDDVGSDAQDGQPPFHLIVNDRPESQLRIGFEFGPWESDSAPAAPSQWTMYLRQCGGTDGPSYINVWLNPSSNLTDYGLLWLNPNPGAPLPRYMYGVGDPRFSGVPGIGIGSTFQCDAFDLATSINANYSTAPGVFNLLQIGLDQTTIARNDYLMGGFAIQPMDIRIEAVLYAQEGSFFVLPGNWFNPNPGDTPTPARGRQQGMEAADKRFPFFGDPLDVRIIIDGAVSENMPAPLGAVEEWMSKWGNIPPTYGSSGKATAHPGEGFTILYDDHVGWPYSDLAAGAAPTQPIRTDKFGRPLPITPRLPVSGSLIYFGDVM